MGLRLTEDRTQQEESGGVTLRFRLESVTEGGREPESVSVGWFALGLLLTIAAAWCVDLIVG